MFIILTYVNSHAYEYCKTFVTLGKIFKSCKIFFSLWIKHNLIPINVNVFCPYIKYFWTQSICTLIYTPETRHNYKRRAINNLWICPSPLTWDVNNLYWHLTYRLNLKCLPNHTNVRKCRQKHNYIY